MSRIIQSDWHGSLPCRNEACTQSHLNVEGADFHPGYYIQIKGENSFEVCGQKVWKTGKVVQLSRSNYRVPMPGSTDVRLLVIEDDLSCRVFDYPSQLKDLSAIFREAIDLEESSRGPI